VRTRFAGLSEEEVARHLGELAKTRDTVLDNARLQPGDTVVDVGAGTGLLTIGALERIGDDGTVFAVDPSVDALDALRRNVSRGGVSYLVGTAEVLPLPDESADAAVARSVLMYVADLAEAARELHRVLRRGGRLSVFEPLNKHATYIYDTVVWPDDLRDQVHDEGRAYMGRATGLVALDERELERLLAAAGFVSVELDVREWFEDWTVTAESADARFDSVPAAGEPSLRQRWESAFPAADVERLVSHLKGLTGQTLKFKRVSVFISAVRP
jgi:arsenite methyltransferase